MGVQHRSGEFISAKIWDEKRSGESYDPKTQDPIYRYLPEV